MSDLQFKNAITMSGLIPPENIVTDGKIHRFSTSDKNKNKSGWYAFHTDGIPAGAFGCWRTGINQKWCADIGRELTTKEKLDYQTKMNSINQKRDAEQLKIYAEAKTKALKIWNEAPPAKDHSYLTTKNIKPYGARQEFGYLFLPLYENDELHSLQVIKENGFKQFLSGGKTKGCYFTIGKIDKVLCICEGYATGATIHEATNYAVTVAFTVSNLRAVAKTMRSKYPQIKIIICADDDYKTDGNPGLTNANETAHAVNGLLARPKFGTPRKEKDTDFNDMAQESGLQAVKLIIEDSLKNDGVTLLKASELNPKPISWLWNSWIASGKLHLLGGVAGTGKTTISLSLASTITNGGRFPDGVQSEVGNVVMWSGEDDISDTLTPRLMAMGANLEKVHFVGDINMAGEERPFDPSSDLSKLKEAIEKIGNVKLLIIDPIVAVANGDSHKNSEVRKDLAPLVQMAESLGFAIIGITHFTKGTTGREPVERITGSLAFGAVARVVLVASKTTNQDGEDVRIFARAKSNIGSDEGGFEYSLEASTTESGIDTSKVKWGGIIEGSARELLNDAEQDFDGGGVKDCMALITELLLNGSVKADQMEKDCKGAGYSISTIKRAKNKLGIKSRKTGGFNGYWVWETSKSIKDAEEYHTQNVNPFVPFAEIEHLHKESILVEGEI